MGETKEKLLPGTTATFVERGEKGFSKIEMLLDATGGLSLSQVCAVTGLEGSTIQNWVKRGWVAHPEGKKYEEVHIARILIINALKECIKLEHIAMLMTYVNGSVEDDTDDIIRESELFNLLCDALYHMGSATDSSRSGVEAVVESVIVDYVGPKPSSRIRIRKALTLMIFACVCSDVKRRTETMMDQILLELDDPAILEAEADAEAEAKIKAESDAQDSLKDISKDNSKDNVKDSMAADAGAESGHADEKNSVESVALAGEASADEITNPVLRKTISQALREWDFSSVERVIIEAEPDTKTVKEKAEEEEKASNRPWYMRRK